MRFKLKKDSPESFRKLVNSLEWYHTLDLGNGLLTPGHYDHRDYLKYFGIPDDLSGKRALDIGAASGYFSFEMEKRGAEVVAIDLPRWMGHDFGLHYKPDRTLKELESYLDEPFKLAKHVLGSKVKMRKLNIYEISPKKLGFFDLVFCGSLLLHLTDPIKALWRIRSVTRDMAIIATGIHKDENAKPLALFSGLSGGTTWWLPNKRCLEEMVASAGFKKWEIFSEFRMDFRDGGQGHHTCVIKAWTKITP
jgi:tRNA (mo5U34)-methyltransferase